MISFLIGSFVGLVMALTGAGGALISIPLLVDFHGLTLKEASVMSLLTVFMASIINYFFSNKQINYKLSIQILLFSLIGTMSVAPFKAILPDFMIVLALVLISAFSLFVIWQPLKVKKENVHVYSFKITLLVGISLGILTTITGLGGGVLLMPALMYFFSLRQEIAISSSLLIVGFSSLLSFIMQMTKGNNILPYKELFFLGFGILAIAIILKFFLKKIPENIIREISRVLFSLVIIYSVIKVVLIKT